MSLGSTPPKYAALLAYNSDYDSREKLIRMCTGCSSQPLSYHDGVVEIEIRLTDKVLNGDNVENLINSLANIWKEAVPDAKLYRAHIYKTGFAKAGFLASPSKLKGEDGKPDKDKIKQLAASMNKMLTAERIDVKIDERVWPGEG